MSTRGHECIAILGMKNTGKTTFFIEMARKVYDLRKQTVVMILRTDPECTRNIDRVHSWEQLARVKCGLVKFYAPETDDPFEMLRTYRKLLDKGRLRNGALFLDDCTNYLDANPDRSVKGLITDHRHYGLDLYLGTHAFSFLPKFCRKLLNHVVIMKTLDGFEDERELRDLKYPAYRPLFAAWQQVMADPNQYARRTISTGI